MTNYITISRYLPKSDSSTTVPPSGSHSNKGISKQFSSNSFHSNDKNYIYMSQPSRLRYLSHQRAVNAQRACSHARASTSHTRKVWKKRKARQKFRPVSSRDGRDGCLFLCKCHPRLPRRNPFRYTTFIATKEVKRKR